MPTRVDVGLPRVAVLVATRNGGQWIDAQIDSILAQSGVAPRIIVSDDDSTDDTLDRLARYGNDVSIMTPGRFGSAQANFARLIREAKTTDVDAVAFADQDDVWIPGKLQRQLDQLAHADAVSSSVTAVFGDGRRRLIDKARPQRRWDYLLESGGPGCTFLLRPSTHAFVRDVMSTWRSTASEVAHDWLMYATVRASGRRWHIDATPLVEYRQHTGNVRGANVGVRQAAVRLAEIRSGEHRAHAAAVAEVAAAVAAPEEAEHLDRLAALLRSPDSARSRAGLLRVSGELRRASLDRQALRVLMALGVW